MSPSGTATVLRPGHDDHRWGPPVPGVELRLRAPDGSLAPWDGAATGELEARGPWVAAAYLEPDDDANATRFTADGWFRTGDVARIAPDGAVEIVDREKDLVKSGGEWISSAELERAIVEHPQVREVVVIGVPDEEWGERPAALVVPERGAAPAPAELRAWLGGRVARWWIPSVWETVEELPKTGVGKYDKRALRARYAER
jgi:fatty-acyl-CoA synthase